MSDEAKEIIAGCPEVWNRVCHIDQVTFKALEKRITAALRERERAVWEEAAKLADRCTYMSPNPLPGGSFGGPARCEYGCGAVIADECRSKKEETPLSSRGPSPMGAEGGKEELGW